MSGDKRATRYIHDSIALKGHIPTYLGLHQANTKTGQHDISSSANSQISTPPPVPDTLLEASQRRDRHERPRALLPSNRDPPRKTKNIIEQSPYASLDRLGTLYQHKKEFVLYKDRQSPFTMGMLQEIKDARKGEFEYKVLMSLSNKHIIRPISAFRWNGTFFLGFEYCRHTLQELLHVHIHLQEQHIQQVAKPVSFGK